MVLFLKDSEIWQWQSKHDEWKRNDKIVLMAIFNKIRSKIKLFLNLLCYFISSFLLTLCEEGGDDPETFFI